MNALTLGHRGRRWLICLSLCCAVPAAVGCGKNRDSDREGAETGGAGGAGGPSMGGSLGGGNPGGTPSTGATTGSGGDTGGSTTGGRATGGATTGGSRATGGAGVAGAEIGGTLATGGTAEAGAEAVGGRAGGEPGGGQAGTATGSGGAALGGVAGAQSGAGGTSGGAGGASGGAGGASGGAGGASGGAGGAVAQSGGAAGHGGEDCPEGWTGAACTQCVVYVDREAGDNGDDGRSWANAKRDLQAAVDEADADPAKCHVWVARGTYVPTYKADPFGASDTATLLLPSSLAIYGGFAGGERSLAERDPANNPTVLTGEIGEAGIDDNLQIVVTTPSGGTLDGLTIRDGNPLNSGAVRCDDGTLVLTDVTFENNLGGPAVRAAAAVEITRGHFADNTQAIEATEGPLTIEDSQFLRSESRAIVADGDLHVTDSVFEANLISVDEGVAEGAAIQASGDTTVLNGCRFSDNQAIYTGTWSPNYVRGGAVNHEGSGSLVVRDCVFERNLAQSLSDYAWGGALAIDSGTARIEGTTFTDNHADGEYVEGGALNTAGPIELHDCSFTGNLVTTSFSGSCGAWACRNCDAYAANVEFEGNSSVDVGGAACLTNGAATLVNAVFASNTTDSRGGALFINGNATELVGCTLFDNAAGERGGGIYVANEAIRVTNAILWGNQAGIDGDQGYADASGSTELTYSDMEGSGFTGQSGNIDDDPSFVSTTPGALDLRLAAGSPCINAGTNEGLPPDSVDLDGDTNLEEPVPRDLGARPRIADGTVDMGAYEDQP